jgi:hypothetical protein
VTRVEFWTADETTDIDIYIYGDFNGTAPSNLLASQLDNAFTEAGYHSIELNHPMAVPSGEDVVAVVKFTDATYGYPVVVDQNGPIETGRTYLSISGQSGSWVDMGAMHDSDVAIRLRTTTSEPIVRDQFAYLPLIQRPIPPAPATPVLDPIDNPDGDGDYTVSWAPAYLADTYILQEDDHNAFSSPTVYPPTTGTSKSFFGRAAGIYFYQVKAINSWGHSGWSHIRSVTVDQPGPTGITNGDFEDGAIGWTEYSTHGWDLIVRDFPSGVTARGGSWAAWLGGDHNDISFIQQQVTVPPSSPRFTYWHWIASGDLCILDVDVAGVIVNGAQVVDRYDLCQSQSTEGWIEHTVNLSAYAGQSISLQIRVETDSSFNSNLFVDDVSFQASASSIERAPRRFDPRFIARKPMAGTSQTLEERPTRTTESLLR